MAAYRIAIMNEDIGKFVYDKMQQKTKKDKNHEKDLTKNLWFKVYLVTCLHFTKTYFVACEVYAYAIM